MRPDPELSRFAKVNRSRPGRTGTIEFTQSDLELALERDSEQNALVAEQEQRIAELYLAGADTALAHGLLETFRDSLLFKERELGLIRGTLDTGWRRSPALACSPDVPVLARRNLRSRVIVAMARLI